jgi:hypothetical protein
MKIRILVFMIFLITTSLSTYSQQYGIVEYEIPGRNILKANLTGLLLRNYGAQYERVLSHRVSVGLSFRYMPEGPIPFKSTIINNLEDTDQETIDQINSLRLSSMAITPEVRFYLSKKGWGRGFYLAPFYRYASHEVNNVNVEYEDAVSGPSTIAMTGKMSSNTGGLLIGAQWDIGTNLVLDWWIIGPHLGGGNGELKGTSSRPLTASEQADLKNELESIDFPFGIESQVTVNANGAQMKLNGPVAGVRAAIQLGIRF